MAESDLLFTIAEVAVAFAGFASLVAILGRRSSKDDPRVLGARMRAMILFSLLAVAFSLLPPVLYRYGLDESATWRVASALFALAFAGVVAWRVSARSRLLRLDVPRPKNAPLIGAVVLSTIAAGVLVLVLNAFAIAPSVMAARYLTVLGLLLFLAGFAFSLIVFSFLPALDSE